MSARNQFFLHKKLSIKNLINICLILFLILGVFVISYYVKNNKKILKSKAEQIQYCSASKYGIILEIFLLELKAVALTDIGIGVNLMDLGLISRTVLRRSI